MTIHALSFGRKAPTWVNDGIAAYQQRLRPPWNLVWHTLSPVSPQRAPNRAKRLALEWERVQKALPKQPFLILCDRQGDAWDQATLASCLVGCFDTGRTPCVVLGSADGLDADAKASADCLWSLSSLTFPHMLMRVMVTEQLYRSACWQQGHPYHTGHAG